MSFNVYNEASDYFADLLSRYEGEDRAEVTLSELVEADSYETEFCYSVYTSSLFEALSQDLRIVGYAEDVEKEFGIGIATNPLLINEAIKQYIIETYGDKSASYFDIDVAV